MPGRHNSPTIFWDTHPDNIRDSPSQLPNGNSTLLVINSLLLLPPSLLLQSQTCHPLGGLHSHKYLLASILAPSCINASISETPTTIPVQPCPGVSLFPQTLQSLLLRNSHQILLFGLMGTSGHLMLFFLLLSPIFLHLHPG